MINIQKTSQITKIYLVENCYGDPNKVYIGKTIGSRKNAHRKNFGLTITYTYIDKVNSIKKEDYIPLEKYWIEQFRQWGFQLMNRNKGGGGCCFHSDETKNKMSKPRPGSGPQGPRPEWVKELMRTPLSEETKLKMKGILHPGAGPQGPRPEWVKELMRKPHPNSRKAILQYDLDCNFIKEWDSSITASKELDINMSHINSCCRGESKTSGGFIWRYKNNPLEKNYKIPKNKNKKTVLQYNLDGTFIKEWESLIDIVLFYGMDQGGLSACLNGRIKTCMKYKWKFKE